MKHLSKIQSEFSKRALSEKERLKKPLNVDINLELRIGGNANPSWKIDTNIDEEEYSYFRDSGEEPTEKNYLEWAAQLREIAKWLVNKSKAN